MSLAVTELTVTTSTGRTLLENCSWQVESGGRLGIIGESGSGKSMTALAILGLLPDGMRATGSVTLDGTEILGQPERVFQRVRGRRIAIQFQEPMTALDPLMRIGRQLTGPLRLHLGLSRAAAQARASELLHAVALPARAGAAYPWQLSGGQRQRAALAIALAAEPEVLIADEPTTALDATVQAEVLDLLSRLVETTGTTLVFISHDIPVIARVSQDLVVMRHGHVVERASVSQTLTAPRDAYTAQLVAAARAVGRIPGVTDA